MEKAENGRRRLTRHNGRAGKDGTFKANHNDRSFNVENAEHIDSGRVGQNIYWDCYRGLAMQGFRENPELENYSFEEIERNFYATQYDGYLCGQHDRNAKTRHTDRNKTAADLYEDKRWCPEESIYQIGTMGDSVSPDILVTIVSEYIAEFDRLFGEHVHVLDWALHLDEATPHIHERHVFDYTNRYGEIEPKQDKALEALGIGIRYPDKKPGRNNNRKMTFDAICRAMLFDICKKHGLDLEEEPDPNTRGHMETLQYKISKQAETIAEQEQMISEQEQRLAEVSIRLDDAEKLIDEVTEIAYDKAVEVVTDVVRAETQIQDAETIAEYRKKYESPDSTVPEKQRNYAVRILKKAEGLIQGAAQKALARVQSILQKPEVRDSAKKKVKEEARESVLATLKRLQDEQKAPKPGSGKQKYQSKQAHRSQPLYPGRDG